MNDDIKEEKTSIHQLNSYIKLSYPQGIFNDEQSLFIYEDRIEFSYKDKLVATMKKGMKKVKYYMLKRFINKVFKTNFELETEQTMLYVNDEVLFDPMHIMEMNK